MQLKTIKKEIDINAPKEKVWDVLLQDEKNRIWYGEFSEGTYAQTDWKEGSNVIFADGTGDGMIARVVANKPAELLDLELTGELKGGKEDYDGDMAKAIQGNHETYRLSGTDGVTHLDISTGMSSDYFDTMSAAWDRALQKIKSLAEAH